MREKRLFALVVAMMLSAAGLAFGTTATYTNIIAADAPVAFWPLNETSGTVIHDVVSTNNGTIVNPAGVALGLPGILYSGGVTADTGIYFTNTSSGYITVPYNTNFNSTSFSVEAWLNLPTFPATGAGANMNPLSFCNGSAAYGWTWNINPANGSGAVVSGWCAVGGGWTSISSGAPMPSKWTYYVITYDGTTFSSYTNGVLAGSHASTYRKVNAGNALFLGDYNDGGTTPDGARYYRGGMENVAVYGYTLTPSQVATHYFYGTNSGTTFITTQPASQTNYVGLTANFNVSAIGLPPLGFQWMAGSTGSGVYTNLIVNSQVPAVTNTTLTISNLTLNNAADYVVVVTNTYGSVTSLVARLTILTNLLPAIVIEPASETNYVGLAASFNVTATGFPPLYYQWQAGASGSGDYTNLIVNGQISSVTDSTLTINDSAACNAADYVVVVTNAYGSITSSVASLIIQTNTAYTNTVKVMCIGDSITDIDTCWWRVDLASNLVNDGYNFLMVGRQQGTLGPINQRHHEGYSGYTTSQILSILPGMMAANLPDIAMLHIGANDMSADAPNKTLDNTRLIVQGLQASNANMTIVVSMIIPNTHGGQINELDYLIPQMCLQLQTPTSHVVVADVFDGFDEPTMFDGGQGPHPNAVGGRFMCNVYTPILESLLNGHIPANPPLLDPWPGPPGFTFCSFANSSSPYALNFATPVTVAWGRITNNVYQSQNFVFKSNVSGAFTFNNNLGDPAPGYEKFGFVQQSPSTFVSAKRLAPHQVQMQFSGSTNQTYTLQAANTLTAFSSNTTTLGLNNDTPPNGFPIAPPGWVSVSSVTTSTNTAFILTDPNATGSLGYYRVFQGP